MTFVVGPFIHGVGTHQHVLKVEYTTGLDLFTGRTLCGRKGGIRASWQMHSIGNVASKLHEMENPCGRCAQIIEERYL